MGRSRQSPLLKKGDNFNKLTVIEEVAVRDAKGRLRRMVKCECECGTIDVFDYYALTKGRLIGCGCNYKLDITDKKVGLLTAKYPLEERDSDGRIMWHCECKCGNTISYAATHFIERRRTSCGCEDVTDVERGEQLKKANEEHKVDGVYVPWLTQKISKNNTSGHKGVHWDSRKQRWIATIYFQRKKIRLGSSKKLEEAVRMRLDGEEKYYKPYIEKLEKIDRERMNENGKNGQRNEDG